MSLFNLAATLTLNAADYMKGLDEAGRKANSFGTVIGRGFNAAGAALLSVGTAATTAAVGGMATLTKKAVEGYAEYEQLVGGVETLFDKSADVVLEYANQAYKTAGMSANEYMDTVTGFSASLLQSLGGDTKAAADYADMAIRDMSDNANKMGTSMEAIQNAYSGFAKGNFTMLDNLKLGYGGTASEMTRLIEDAEKLDSSFVATRDENGKLTMSYADIVDAVHIVQDNMGITGTTAEEASKTISGSVASMKTAWSNLVVAMADENADMDTSVNNFVESASTVFDNLIPRISTTISGMGPVVSALIPKLVQVLKDTVINNLPTLVDTAVSTVNEIINAVVEALPAFAEALLSLIESLTHVLIDNLPIILDTLLTIVETIATNIGEALPVLLPAIIEVILQLAQTLIDHLPELLEALATLIDGLAQGIIDSIPVIIEKLPEIITSVVNALTATDTLKQLIETGITLFVALIGAMPDIIKVIVDALPEIITSVIEALTDPEVLKQIIDAGITLLGAIIDAIPEIIVSLVEALPSIITSIVDGIKAGWENVKEAGKELIEGVWSGIKDKAAWLWEQVKGWAGGILDKVKNFFGIHSPSTVFRDVIGKNLVAGLGDGIDRYADIALDSMEELANDILDAASIEPTISFRNNGINESVAPSRAVQITQNIYSKEMTPSEIFESAKEQQERLVLMGV